MSAYSGASLPCFAEETIRKLADLPLACAAQELARNTLVRRAEAPMHCVSDSQYSYALAILAHAGEHLDDARWFAIEAQPGSVNVEAIHILKRLSRSLFEEHAGRTMRRQRLEEWLKERITEVFGSGREAANWSAS
jgi:hypothetical protein